MSQLGVQALRHRTSRSAEKGVGGVGEELDSKVVGDHTVAPGREGDSTRGLGCSRDDGSNPARRGLSLNHEEGRRAREVTNIDRRTDPRNRGTTRDKDEFGFSRAPASSVTA